MTRPSIALLVVLAGCGGGGGDAGPDAALPRQLSYTPRGCGYMVSTPEVLEAEPGNAARGAQPAPTQVHVSWAGSPTSTFAVNWMSDADTKLSQVLYSTDQALVSAADGPATEAGPLGHQDGHTLVYSSLFPAGETRLHEVHVCGLMADTRYFYKVGGPGAWSKVFDITTAPMAGTAGPFKFAVSGDSRDNPTIFADVQQRIAAAGPDFQLFSGDAVLLGASEGDWRKWFDATSTSGMAAEEVLARVPFMFADGNHESLSQIFLSRFALPQELSDGESGQGEEWYSFDYGNAHFVVLNDSVSSTTVLTGSEPTWLRADLGKVDRQKTPWIFVMHHQGAYSCASNHGSNLAVRAALQPIYDEFKVDVVWNGHDHDYERSHPIRGFQPGSTEGALATEGADGVPVAESGTIYIVSGGAGASLYGSSTACFHTLKAESVNNYLIVDVDGRMLRVTAYRLDGSVLDQFTYSK